MLLESRFFGLICALTILPTHMLRADVPVVQLSVQPAQLPNHDSFVANTLLRELQRQAILIAAREELGIATRDMVLREPFALHGVDGVTTVLCSTRVEKNQNAQVFLSRFDGPQPADTFSLADLPVDQPQNNCRQSVSFSISKNPLVDYPEFVTRCEEASRTTYLKAIKAENLLGTFVQQPTRWADEGPSAEADAHTLLLLQHLDVFSQYVALRRLHAQLRTDGASTARLRALVRGYANLGQLTRSQWSFAGKVYLARALLYAQRLVVHENGSSASLYVRAYARAFAGMHTAALDDLSAADKQQSATPPAWASLIKAMCLYDAQSLEESLAFGSWRYRPLAAYLSARVQQDDFPLSQQEQALTRAVSGYPGLFVLDPLPNSDQSDNDQPRTGEQFASQLPAVLAESLKEAQLPPPVQALVPLVQQGDKVYQRLRDLREGLNDAATKLRDTTEPSYAVLADLIEQQAMLGVVHRVVAGQADLKPLMLSAHPILKAHPWGPLVEAMDNSADVGSLNSMIAKVKDHDPGPWIQAAMNDSFRLTGSGKKQLKRWKEAANLSADSLVDDYTQASIAAKNRRAIEPALSQLRQTSPHSAVLLNAWMDSFSMDLSAKKKQAYTDTLNLIENEFSDRPPILLQACDWADTRGDFTQSLKLLQKTNQVEPTDRTSGRLGQVEWHLGKHDAAIDELLRGVHLSDDSTEVTALYQRAGYFLICDRRYAEALADVQLASEVATPRTWQLMARCYEAMGKLNDAQECLRQQAILDPSTYSQYYLWARRLDRADANAIRQLATAYFAKSNESFFARYFVLMADNEEAQAFDLLRKKHDQMDDAYEYAELAILAKKRNNTKVFTNNVNALRNFGGDHHSFGTALRSLMQSTDLQNGIRNFDRWVNRQLDDEDSVDWFSIAGRYLVEAGQVPDGKTYLIRAIQSSATERETYYLAYRELQNLGENPKKLMAATTQAAVP